MESYVKIFFKVHVMDFKISHKISLSSHKASLPSHKIFLPSHGMVTGWPRSRNKNEKLTVDIVDNYEGI